MNDTPLLKVTDLSKHFTLGGGLFSKPRAYIKAVNGVSFDLARGETLGLVGESGCGKTTLGRLIMRLVSPGSGRIEFDGKDITALHGRNLRVLRRDMQMIFQDPFSSLDPRMKVEAIVTEPMRALSGISRDKRRRTAAHLFEKVGLSAMDLDKYPHAFSGGQRQRIGIARALCLRPQLVVADEPVSALDVSIQAQVVNLLADLKRAFSLSYVFISHDLSVVAHICDRIAVMYLGKIVESAPAADLIKGPRHPYTQALLSAIPLPNPHEKTAPLALTGDVPDPFDMPQGCAFHPRCPFAFEKCHLKTPLLVAAKPAHSVACWLNNGRGLKGENV